MRLVLLLFLSFGLYADNEVFVSQTGSNAVIKLEQLGSSNLIGGTNASAGSLTALGLSGSDMTLTINQIGTSNLFKADDFNGDNVTAYWNFAGDSNVFDLVMNSLEANTSDYVNLNIQATGSSNTFDLAIAEDSDAGYLNLDWLIDGDSNELTATIDYENATNYIDILGDSNTLTFAGSGYAGNTSSDAGYFYLDLDGSSNTFNITQASTLARDYLKITANGSNSSWCIVQNDGGTSTSC
tara:strand:- start:4836 stop:5555 length:720 start_codon:yes stop_codon:yes gene_type:complete